MTKSSNRPKTTVKGQGGHVVKSWRDVGRLGYGSGGAADSPEEFENELAGEDDGGEASAEERGLAGVGELYAGELLE